MKYLLLFAASIAVAQDPVASLEGFVRDATGAPISGVTLNAENLDTASINPLSVPAMVPIALRDCRLAVTRSPLNMLDSRVFAQQPIELNVSQSVRLDVALQLASQRDSVTIEADATLVDSSTNIIGKTVSTREISTCL